MNKTPPLLNGSESAQNRSLPLSRALITAALLGSTLPACHAQTQATSPSTFEPADSDAHEAKNTVFMTPTMSVSDKERADFAPFNSQKRDLPETDQPIKDIPTIETPEIIIKVKRPNGPWPEIPENCVYTGVILEHHRDSDPHQIVLENMCYRKKGDPRRQPPYSGESVYVEADKKGHYDLPYHDVHLEERGRTLYFVLETRDDVMKAVHAPRSYEPGIYSFRDMLDMYRVRSIR